MSPCPLAPPSQPGPDAFLNSLCPPRTRTCAPPGRAAVCLAVMPAPGARTAHGAGRRSRALGAQTLCTPSRLRKRDGDARSRVTGPSTVPGRSRCPASVHVAVAAALRSRLSEREGATEKTFPGFCTSEEIRSSVCSRNTPSACAGPGPARRRGGQGGALAGNRQGEREAEESPHRTLRCFLGPCRPPPQSRPSSPRSVPRLP